MNTPSLPGQILNPTKVPPRQIAWILAGALTDPLTLLNGGGLSHLGKQAGPLTGAAAHGSAAPAAFQILKEAFGSAMQEVFLLGMAVLLVSLAIAWHLKEIPLRTSNQTLEGGGSSSLADGGLAG